MDKKCEKLAFAEKYIYLCPAMSTTILILLIILCLVLAICGIVGTFIPALPGPPFSWASLLVAYLAFPPYISRLTLWVMLLLTLLVLVLDYVAPIWMTKAGGGSKAATTGSTVGLILGLMFMPLGLILGPIVGAFVGEMMSTNDAGRAVKMAALSFISFLLTTGMKLAICLVMTFYAGMAIWSYLT